MKMQKSLNIYTYMYNMYRNNMNCTIKKSKSVLKKKKSVSVLKFSCQYLN